MERIAYRQLDCKENNILSATIFFQFLINSSPSKDSFFYKTYKRLILKQLEFLVSSANPVKNRARIPGTGRGNLRGNLTLDLKQNWIR